MKKLILTTLVFAFIIVSCERFNDIDNHLVGHLKIEVQRRVNWVGYVPDDGAKVYLYDKNACCRNYLDAVNEVAFIGEKSYRSIISSNTNSEGLILIDNIPVGEYYLVLRSYNNRRYSECGIQILKEETLELRKNFTNDGDYTELLEPWDHSIPNDEFLPN